MRACLHLLVKPGQQSIVDAANMVGRLPANDTTLIVMLVGVSSGISLLGNIWLAGIFMMLFFPMNLWLVAILLMLIWLAGQQISNRFEKNMPANESR
ncbi:hypothetical protein [Limosilactobacillus mucosae]|uniref:hypothetical protein n=1 Tax=uncultured Limosilactobacillus sp. TaxID=2837629 RepID=UPI001DF9A246|nr:hypothetical protein [uncultured Limosilactobacillus sp.]MBN2901866.1 hypothetical protein [Limosilactobacillus mucosae]